MHPLLEQVECRPIGSTDGSAGLTLETVLDSLSVEKPCKVLLVNATKGIQYYPSIVDFFSGLMQKQPSLQVTSASYFEETWEYGRGVREKGLPTLSIDALAECSLRQLNLLDVIIAVGPSTAFVQLRAMKGLTARLILLDLAFYHQLMDLADSQTLTSTQFSPGATAENAVVCYSCQPLEKARKDLNNAGVETDPEGWSWRWLPYIPLGYQYRRYYQADRYLFDVAFLGANNRDYGTLDKAVLGDKKILFVGSSQYTEKLKRDFSDLDITYVEKVEEDTYYRLLSVCRCIVLPYDMKRKNCFLSIQDALATGTPLLTSEHEGIRRLKELGAPLHLYSSETFGTTLTRVLAVVDQAQMRRESRAFCTEHLDIHGVLHRVVVEQLPVVEVQD